MPGTVNGHLPSAAQLPLRTVSRKRVDTMPAAFSPTISTGMASTSVVGMPEMTPVTGSSVRPAGSRLSTTSLTLKYWIRFTKEGVSGSISTSFTSVTLSTP